jgi:tetratricopeptide (TPR) repeat protein
MEMQALQGELLGEQDGGARDETHRERDVGASSEASAPASAPAPPSGPAPDPPSAPAPPVAGPDAADARREGEEARDADEAKDAPVHEHVADLPPPGAPAERWARAVGRRPPSRASEAVSAQSNGAALVRPNGQELHESARDHAAAGMRPAGEPLARAKELVQQGRADEAIELYLGILTVNPSNLKAHNNLGVLLDELRQYEQALEHFAAAESIAPENVEVLTNFASTLTSVARYDQAEALLRRAQKLDADGLEVRLAIGILYFRRGLYGQAEVELRWVCARSRADGSAFYYRGEALNRLGRFEEARLTMERAKALLPNDPRPYYTLGHLYDRKHQVEEAAEMYRQSRRLQQR